MLSRRTVRSLLAILLLAPILVGGTACRWWSRRPQITTPDGVAEIRIGVLEPLTGPDAVAGQLASEGLELANSLQPEILGTRVRLISADAGADIASATAATKKLVEQEKVAAIVGSYGDERSAAIVAEAAKAGVPVVVDAATGAAVTAQGGAVRVTFNQTWQGGALARYAVGSLRAARAGVVIIAGQEQSRAVGEGFHNQFAALMPDPLALTEVTVTLGTADLRAQLAPIIAAAPDVIVAAGAPAEAAQVIKQLRLLGFWKPILGSDAWDTPSFPALVGREGEGVVFTSPFALDVAAGTFVAPPVVPGGPAVVPTPSAAASAFVIAYRDRYTGKQPTVLTALAYDAYNVLLAAIERARGTDPGALRTALAAVRTQEGATGTLAFDGGTEARRGGVIKQIKGGAVVTVQIVGAE